MGQLYRLTATKDEKSDEVWIYVAGVLIAAVISKYLWDNFRNEMLFFLVGMLVLGLVANIYSTVRLWRMEGPFPPKVIVWSFGSLGILIASIIVLFVTFNSPQYIDPVARDLGQSLFISLYQLFGLVFLFVTILGNTVMQVKSWFEVRNIQDDEYDDEKTFEFPSYYNLVLIILLITLILASVFGIGLLPESLGFFK